MGQYYYDKPDLDDINDSLYGKNNDLNRIKLEHRSPTYGTLTLRVPQSPDDNSEDAINFLREKAGNWADKVRDGHLSQHKA